MTFKGLYVKSKGLNNINKLEGGDKDVYQLKGGDKQIF